MNCAICWNSLFLGLDQENNDEITMVISGLLALSDKPQPSQNISDQRQSAGNQKQQVCKRAIASLVGTSETTRAAPFTANFCEWLAGLIDGDGCLLVSKKGYTSLEITMDLTDEKSLRFIQDKLGGSIKMRSGAEAWRYRLHNKEGMIQLINLINGHIRHSTRLVQLHRVCQVLNINVIYPLPLTKENGWFSGFFDADGTITMSMKGLPGKPKYPQVSIRVTNKLLVDVQWFSLVFGGNIYFDNSQNGYYQWSVQSREKIMEMSEYFSNYPSRSHKSKRIHLIKKYYELLDLQAYKSDSNLHKAWLDFQNSWLCRFSSPDDLGGMASI